MKKILFYYPSNKRTISIESLIIGFKYQGYQVILLTQSDESELHEQLHKNEIETYTYVIKKNKAIIYYFRHFLYLIKFCKKNDINIVYSHLQQANIISVFAQFFCSSKFYICRHHSSVSGSERNFNQSLFDKVINKLAKLIIVPSKMVQKQVCEVEGVNPNKVKLIYYGYDFEKYPKPNQNEVKKIRLQFSAKLLLVKVARLVPGKRYNELFNVLKKMVIDENKDVKLLVISEGPLMAEFKTYIDSNHLINHIFLLGNVENVIDYLAAADVVPLLSEAEASNSVIKEAGLVSKTVVVCRNVGDFEDYIEQQINGYLIPKDNPERDLDEVLNLLYNENPRYIGDGLKKSVLNTFSIDAVISSYYNLNNF